MDTSAIAIHILIATVHHKFLSFPANTIVFGEEIAVTSLQCYFAASTTEVEDALVSSDHFYSTVLLSSADFQLLNIFRL